VKHLGGELFWFGCVCLAMTAVYRILAGHDAFEFGKKSRGTYMSAYFPLWLYGGLVAVVLGGALWLFGHLV
jgi:hypothetical protein